MTSRVLETGRRSGRRAVRSPWLHAAARAGLVARGVLYLLMGVLGLVIAAVRPGPEADRAGAMHVIGSRQLGEVLLWLLALALAGYGVWLLAMAGWGFTEVGDRRKRWLRRLGALVPGVFYVAAAASTALYTLGRDAGGSDRQHVRWAAWVLARPEGQVVMVLAGVTIVAVAVGVGIFGALTKFADQLATQRLSRGGRRLIAVVGVCGQLGRGALFATVGVLVARAGWTFDVRDAGGPDTSLRWVERLPWGSALLVVLCCGVLLFGVYSFVEARYRKM